MNLLHGKSGLIFGVANERSYGWHIAKALIDNGAHCSFGVMPGQKMEARARLAIEALELREEWVVPCNCAEDEDLGRIFEAYGRDHDRLDFVIHSIAFADKQYLVPGKFVDTSREVFMTALDISVFSLITMARLAREQMSRGGGGAILAMTYIGSQKAVPGYNVMGVAKAALESTVRYLALELGPDNIRANSLSGGPLKTLASAGIKGFKQLLNHDARRAPLQRNVAGSEVGGTAAYLVSDLATGVTGETLHVDCGAHIAGF